MPNGLKTIGLLVLATIALVFPWGFVVLIPIVWYMGSPRQGRTIPKPLFLFPVMPAVPVYSGRAPPR